MTKYWENRRKEEEKFKLSEQEKKKFGEDINEEVEEFNKMEKKQ
jgi:hypothetical protein